MSNDPFYAQIKQQFDRIIEQDRRRRRRISFLLLAFHLFLVIAAALYAWNRAYVPGGPVWYPLHTEVAVMLWCFLAFSVVVHAAAVWFMNRTVVADTVRESLMLLAAHPSNNEPLEMAEKRKRNRNEPDVDDLDSDSLYIAEDGELRHTPERRR